MKQIWQPVIAAVFILAGCKNASKEEKVTAKGDKKPPTVASAFIVTSGSIAENLDLPGTLQADEETALQPEMSGRIVSINIPEGKQVAQGTLLVKLNDADLQAQLKKLEVQLAIAQKTEERQKELLRINGVSQQDYDLSLLQVSNIAADIALTKAQIRKTEIRAPYSGKLGLKNVSLGAYVSPGTIVTTIRQTSSLKLGFNLPEKYAANIKPGSKVPFTIQGTGNQFSATVIATENSVAQTNRSVKVLATVSGKHPNLVPGAFAKVNIKIGNLNDAILVPTQSIIPQARNKKVIRYNNGLAEMVIVETGIRDSARVEIISGLKVGDTILTSGLLTIKPEAPIKLGKIN